MDITHAGVCDALAQSYEAMTHLGALIGHLERYRLSGEPGDAWGARKDAEILTELVNRITCDTKALVRESTAKRAESTVA